MKARIFTDAQKAIIIKQDEEGIKRDLAIRSLRMAIALQAPPRGCIFHSDRGSQ